MITKCYYVLMLVVILGAGASTGATHGFEFDPLPLANQLFDSKYRIHASQTPQVLVIADQVRRRINQGDNVESILEGLQQEATNDPRRAGQLLAVRYYLRRLIFVSARRFLSDIQGDTLYRTLCDRIEYWRTVNKEQVTYITFNYDTLIEDALDLCCGIKIDSFEDYTSSTNTKLIKPHGSTDWYFKIEIDQPDPTESAYDVLLNEASRLQFSPQKMLLNRSNLFGQFLQGTAFVPAIALPLNTDTKFTCPQSHLDTMKTVLGKADKLLIIGWKGNEQHFLDLWGGSGSNPRVSALVGNSEEGLRTLTMNLLKAGISQGLNHYHQGFEEFINDQSLENFLSA